jgi:hypothetical protein
VIQDGCTKNSTLSGSSLNGPARECLVWSLALTVAFFVLRQKSFAASSMPLLIS